MERMVRGFLSVSVRIELIIAPEICLKVEKNQKSSSLHTYRTFIVTLGEGRYLYDSNVEVIGLREFLLEIKG